MANIDWYAPSATVYVSTAITAAANTALHTTVAAASNERALTKVRDVKISVPLIQADIQNYIGNDGDANQPRQNAELIVKPADKASVEFTVTEEGIYIDTTTTDIGGMLSSSGDNYHVTTDIWRFRGGLGTSVTKYCFLLTMISSSKRLNMCLNNAIMTQGNPTLNVDGKMERACKIECASCDYYEEGDNSD